MAASQTNGASLDSCSVVINIFPTYIQQTSGPNPPPVCMDILSPHISQALHSAQSLPLHQRSSNLYVSTPHQLPPVPPLISAAPTMDTPVCPSASTATPSVHDPAWPYLQNVQPVSPSPSPPHLEPMAPILNSDLSSMDTVNLMDILPSTDDLLSADDFPDYLDARAIDAAIQSLESPDLFDNNNNALPSVDNMFDMLDSHKDD